MWVLTMGRVKCCGVLVMMLVMVVVWVCAIHEFLLNANLVVRVGRILWVECVWTLHLGT